MKSYLAPCAAVLLLLSSIHVFAANPVQLENAQPGTSSWQLSNPAFNREIEGYASLTSVNLGSTISFYVNTADSSYHMDIYRMGWYGGTGARAILSSPQYPGIQQLIPSPDSYGTVDCNWTSQYTLTIPFTWVSGFYLAKLTGSSGHQSYIIFVVRDDARPSQFVFVSSVNTYQAYNAWGSKSLYPYNSVGTPAVKVSFNRPYGLGPQSIAASGVGAGDFLTTTAPASETVPAGWEYNTVRWLERQGYDVTYITDVDVDATPSVLLKRSAVIFAGHPEYWSWQLRANVTAARDSGVNLAFLGANVGYWQVRYENSSVTGQSSRTLVCYKSTQDPVGAPLTTVTFRELGYPEDALIGVQYITDAISTDVVVKNTTKWVFNGTGLQDGTLLTGLSGYEVDTYNYNYIRNGQPDFTLLAQSPVGASTYQNMSVYTAASGATVFATGSMQWTWALDDYNSPNLRNSVLNPAAQTITANVLAKFQQAVTPQLALPIHVNVGGPTYDDSTGTHWISDVGVVGVKIGNVYSTTANITKTIAPVVYQTQRYAESFTYQFFVPNGNYQVKLGFAELYYNQPGQRQFNAFVNGTQVLANFDIVAAAGGANTATEQTFNTATSNGKITIQLTSGASDWPVLSSLQIVPSGGVSVQTSPSSVTLMAGQSQQFTSTVSGTSNTSVTWSMTPSVGTLSVAGLYTAPSSITSTQSVTITGTSVADSSASGTSVVALSPPPGAFNPIRVDSGGSSYVDPSGQAWIQDTGFSGGSTYSTGATITNTTTPILYQSQRFGSGFQYQFAVPTGTYLVTLKFAELYFNTAGQRQFNVVLNGNRVLTNFDIVAQAGSINKAIDATFTVVVPNSGITIQFSAGLADSPVVNAIQIVQTSTIATQVTPSSASLSAGQTQQFSATLSGTSNTNVTWSMSPSLGTLSSSGVYTAPPTIHNPQILTISAISAADSNARGTATVNITPPPGYVNIDAGGSNYTDPTGLLWMADNSFNGGSTYSVTNVISNTTTQPLYQSIRYGSSFSYQFSNLPTGTYTVVLKFAEIYYNAPNQRIFNVSINGATVLSGFDIVAAAGGGSTAIDKAFVISVSTGQITIQFNGTVDLAQINAIQITPGP